MPSSKLTEKHRSVLINVTTATRTGIPYQRGNGLERVCEVITAMNLRPTSSLQFTLTDSVCPVAAKRVDGPGSGENFSAVQCVLWDEEFVSGIQRYALATDNERVAALYHQHVFIVIVRMDRRSRRLIAGPKSHLASVGAIEDITLHSPSGLIARGDSIHRTLHELWKTLHVK